MSITYFEIILWNNSKFRQINSRIGLFMNYCLNRFLMFESNASLYKKNFRGIQNVENILRTLQRRSDDPLLYYK